MKATLNGAVLAESGDIISAAGYEYFPAATVHTDLLEKSPRTAKDLSVLIRRRQRTLEEHIVQTLVVPLGVVVRDKFTDGPSQMRFSTVG